MLSPLRLLAIGLATDDVCALHGLTPEELDLLCERKSEEEAETRRRQQSFAPLRSGKLMTRLLSREDVPGWQFRQARRQAR